MEIKEIINRLRDSGSLSESEVYEVALEAADLLEEHAKKKPIAYVNAGFLQNGRESFPDFNVCFNVRYSLEYVEGWIPVFDK